MVYWQWDELQTTGKAQNSAIIGLVMSIAYLFYLLWCFRTDLPESFKNIPVIGKFEQFGWFVFVAFSAWYKT